MVFASRPVVSDSRFAARPVGAQRAIATVLASRILCSELTSVVLPTPGPPVITSTFEPSAARMASLWLSASANLVRFSTQGIAFSASIDGQGGVPAVSARSFFGNLSFRAVQTGKKHAAPPVEIIGYHRAVLQFEVECGCDQLGWDLQ
jgi:hypothetical protein